MWRGSQSVPRRSGLFQQPGLSGVFQQPGLSGLFQQPGLSSLFQHPGLSGLFQHPGLSGVFQQPGLSGVFQQPGLSGVFQQPGLSGLFQQPGLSGLFQHPGLSGLFQQPGLSGLFQQPGLSGVFQQPGLPSLFQQSGLSGVFQHPGLSSLFQHPGLSSLFQQPGLSSLFQQPGLSGLFQQPGLSGVFQQPGPSGLFQHPGLSGLFQQPGLSGLLQQPGLWFPGLSGLFQQPGLSGLFQQPGLSGLFQQPGLSGLFQQPGLSGLFQQPVLFPPVVVPNHGMADNIVAAGTVLPNPVGNSLPGPSQGRNIDKSRKRVRPSSPILGKIQEVVRPQPRFLVMSRVENNEDLKRVSPFILERVINGAAKSEVSIIKLRDGTIMIQTKTDTQSSDIMAISEIPLSNTTHIPVKVEPHRFLNVCKGVVTCYDLDCVSIEDIFNLAKTSSRPVPLVSARDISIGNAPIKSSPPPVPPRNHPRETPPRNHPQETPPSPTRGTPPGPPRGTPPSPPRGTPPSPPRGTPPSPPRGNKLRVAAVESLILASGPPEVGMSGCTGEAIKVSPTGALKKDQRETAGKNIIKKASKALTKPSRKDTTTQSLPNKPKPLLKREVQERLGKARGPKKALNQFLILRDSDMDCEDN
uniref:Uncharacterized protein n=1 Tax=Timema douglasi TaxID=61478 RepID=A0A7R8ZA13_TIMDO|nr:unnamed protein product [Timema douglasi]